MEDDDNFDEFDEFKNFNREELNKLFNERMDDEEFKRKFLGIVGGYQRDFDQVMKMLQMLNGKNNPFNDPYSGLSSSFNPDKGFGNFDIFNKDGWDSQHWSSPDGKNSISSFSRSMTPEEFYEKEKELHSNKLPDGYVLHMLEDKLSTSLEEENYEEAAILRDTIKDLKESE